MSRRHRIKRKRAGKNSGNNQGHPSQDDVASDAKVKSSSKSSSKSAAKFADNQLEAPALPAELIHARADQWSRLGAGFATRSPGEGSDNPVFSNGALKSVLAPVLARLARLPGDIVIVLTLITAYFLRSLHLDLKPTHFDEGINGFFVQKLWREGYYHYDPSNFHGPLYFYFLTLTELFSGRSTVGYRYMNGLISLAAIYFVTKHRRFFGSVALWAAVLLTVSTGFVFYSRYAIHESLFVLCEILFSYGFFMWFEERSRRSMAYMLTGFFASIAIKETFFIFFVTWGIAVAAVWITKPQGVKFPFGRLRLPEEREGFWNQEAGNSDWLTGCSLGILFLILMYTGFFINPGGFSDMFTAYTLWTKTGTANSGHEKPFFYWIQLLYRYEWPILGALGVSLFLYYFAESRRRLLILLTFGTWLAYSIIPYKTPWLMLNLAWPAAFVWGMLFEVLPRLRRWWLRMFARLALLSLLVVNVMTMLRMNFRDYALVSEPYVYVQSTNLMKYDLDFLFDRVRQYPEDLNMRVLALVRDPWPLPWLLSNFPRLAYGAPESIDLADSGMILIDAPKQKQLEDRLLGKFYRLRFQIRDSYENGLCYFDYEKFKGIVPSDSEVFERKDLPPEAHP